MATKVELRYISIASGKEIKPALVKRDVKITANGTTNIFDGEINNEKEESHVLTARFLDRWRDGVVSRTLIGLNAQVSQYERQRG